MGELAGRLVANEHVLVLHDNAGPCSSLVSGEGALARRRVLVREVVEMALLIVYLWGTLVVLVTTCASPRLNHLSGGCLFHGLASQAKLPIGSHHLIRLVAEIIIILRKALPRGRIPAPPGHPLLHVDVMLLLAGRRGVIGFLLNHSTLILYPWHGLLRALIVDLVLHKELLLLNQLILFHSALLAGGSIPCCPGGA